VINRLGEEGGTHLKAFTKLGFSLSVSPTAVPLRDSLLKYSIPQYNTHSYPRNWSIYKEVKIRIQPSLIFSVTD